MVRPALLVILAVLLSPLGSNTAARAQAPKDRADDEVPALRVQAQDAAKGESPAPAKKAQRTAQSPVSIGTLVRQANPMLWPLALCSIVALGFALERFVALRKSRVIPREFVTRFHERLASGKLDRDRAAELCRANESPTARIFGHVVKYWGQPSATIRQALSYEAAGELADLKRNIRVLNGTATLAPLLGLLGTVIGMIESFGAIGSRGPGAAKGEALSHGISLALMTTAFGLAIAIVSVAAYYFLLHRVDALTRQLDDEAGSVIDAISAEAARATADRRHAPAPSELGRHEPYRGIERGARAVE